MQDFSDSAAIQALDVHRTLETTDLLIKQCRTSWDQVMALPIAPLTTPITTIVFCGMGASIYGALVMKSLLGSSFPYPTEVISDYHLPSYVDSRTLVVLTSYSGTTEEVLSCAQEAKQKGAQMLVLTKGGPLAAFAQEHDVPAYIFDGKLNLSSTPRLGNGYSVIGLLGLFHKLNLVPVDTILLKGAFDWIEAKRNALREQAQEDSAMYVDKIPVIFAAEHLSGNAQILRNQFNETSKAFSAMYLVPDLNHHLMEGLQFPSSTPLLFLIAHSQNYTPKIAQRMQLTEDVVLKNKHATVPFKLTGRNAYEDILELMVYGGYLTLFLGLRYDQDPSVNPWVDYFKAELAK